MLTFLPAPLVGVIAAILYLLNLIIIPAIVIILAFVHVITPIKPWRKVLNTILHETIPNTWVKCINGIIWLTTKTQFDIQGRGDLSPQGWYFLISNHRSWLDIIILESVFGQRVPMLKFFMKKSLQWKLPIAGVACKIMGFPFMERYSKEYLKKHPEKKGKDLEETRKACEKFKNQPITVISFIEGTRFTPEKKQRQASPYRHLLKPKAGGFAFVLAAMDGFLNELINVTLVYPDPKTNLWRFMCGKVPKISVRYEVIPIPAEVRGNYYENSAFRVQFQAWLNRVWQDKDQQIDNLLAATQHENNDHPHSHS